MSRPDELIRQLLAAYLKAVRPTQTLTQPSKIFPQTRRGTIGLAQPALLRLAAFRAPPHHSARHTQFLCPAHRRLSASRMARRLLARRSRASQQPCSGTTPSPQDIYHPQPILAASSKPSSRNPASISTSPSAGAKVRTFLREALLIADHSAYHLGELIVVRRLLGAWNK